MEKKSYVEPLSWIASILSCLIAGVTYYATYIRVPHQDSPTSTKSPAVAEPSSDRSAFPPQPKATVSATTQEKDSEQGRPRIRVEDVAFAPPAQQTDTSEARIAYTNAGEFGTRVYNVVNLSFHFKGTAADRASFEAKLFKMMPSDQTIEATDSFDLASQKQVQQVIPGPVLPPENFAAFQEGQGELYVVGRFLYFWKGKTYTTSVCVYMANDEQRKYCSSHNDEK